MKEDSREVIGNISPSYISVNTGQSSQRGKDAEYTMNQKFKQTFREHENQKDSFTQHQGEKLVFLYQIKEKKTAQKI